jgi:hypothetical protein
MSRGPCLALRQRESNSACPLLQLHDSMFIYSRSYRDSTSL